MSHFYTIFGTNLLIMTISKQIEQKIHNSDKGILLFISDFSGIGEYDTVRKSLQRLAEQELIIRLSKGIYYYPKQDDIFGIILPSTEQIAKAIAKRDEARIVPTGSYGLYLLGLSTQIPMNVVYLSDSSARIINIGKQTIIFKKTNPKTLTVNHKLTNLVIQALKTIGKNAITETIICKIEEAITNSEETNMIEDNIKFAPVWIQNIVKKIIKKIKNEDMA